MQAGPENTNTPMPGKRTRIQSLASLPAFQRQTVLVKTTNIEIVHIVIPAGGNVPTHQAEGEIILHCLEGRISVTALGNANELQSGELLFLNANTSFSIHAVDGASVLATIVAPKEGDNVELIGGADRPSPGI